MPSGGRRCHWLWCFPFCQFLNCCLNCVILPFALKKAAEKIEGTTIIIEREVGEGTTVVIEPKA